MLFSYSKLEVYCIRDIHKGNFDCVTPLIEKLCDVPCESLIKDPTLWINLIHPEDRANYILKLQSTVQGEAELVYRLVNEKGETKRVKENWQPIFNSEGICNKVIGIIKEISEESPSYESLFLPSRNCKSIFDFAPIAMAEVTLDGKFIDINPSFSKTFGYSREEILQMTMMEISPPEDLRINLQKDDQLIKENKDCFQMEKRYFHKKGHIIYALLKMVLIKDEKGNLKHYLAQMVDISALKKAKLILGNKNAELRKINKELDLFVYSASHDLRGPLKSLLGLVNLMKIQQDNEKEVEDPYIVNIEQTITKLDTFIESIVQYSYNNRNKVRREVIKFEQILNEILNKIKEKHPRACFEYFQNINKNNSAFFSDPRRLKIVLSHILFNAVQYSDLQKSKVVIEVKVTVKNGICNILISDNGIGIEKEYLPHVFDMFYRGSSKSFGSGLGLYIAKETLNKMHGNIEIVSTLGIGSTVKIEIPNLLE